MMLRTALRRVQRQLADVERRAFCTTSNNSNDGGEKPSKEGAVEQQQVQKPQQQQQQTTTMAGGFMPRQNREWKKNSSGAVQGNTLQNGAGVAAAGAQTNVAATSAAAAAAQSQQGSRINVGTAADIKQSIGKSLTDFSASYKVQFKKPEQKAGVKLVIAEKPVEPLTARRLRLLGQLSESKEELKNKWVSSMPVAQQILVDRLKQYGLRASDAKRMRDTLKEEEGVDFSYVEPRNLELLNSHIHRSAEEMETFISTYIGADTPLSKSEELDEWRQQQAINHIDFTPDTMGVPEAFYPGSELGPKPQDDPLNYAQWFERHCPIPYRPLIDQMTQITEMKVTDSHMPSFIKKWIKDVQQDPEDTFEVKEVNEDDNDSDSNQELSEDEGLGSLGGKNLTRDEAEAQLMSSVGGSLGVFFYRSGTLPRMNADNSSMLSSLQNDMLPEDTSPEEQLINCEGNITFHSGLQEYEIPPFPEKMSQFVTHYQIPVADKWSVFRQFPNMYHWWKRFQEIGTEFSERPISRYQYEGLPSLYTYFNTLPEFARNDLNVQNVARCFEFSRSELSLQQKMMALNYVAKFTLPIDDLIAYAANEMIISNKHFLTAKEEDRLKTVNQFYYEADPDAFEVHLAHEEHTIEQIENFQAPKKLKAEDNEEELCVLPLEYYDNEDGFWTEFIREKYNRNHNAFPVTHSRPFFKH